MPRRTPSRRSLCGAGLLLAALAAGAGGCGGAEDRPPRWSFIAPAIVEPSCATASCHSAAAQRAGVVLDTREGAWQTLTTRHFVTPGDKDASEMVALMRAEGSRRMPPDFALPEADIELIERWITAGATDD